MLLPGTVFLPAATAPHALLPPGLYILAIAFALEVSVGKTNTVMALNGSDILLPCTFTTCIGFQDLIFTWYFNSTELVGALQALPVFSWQLLSDVLLTGCFPPPVGCTPSEQVHHRGEWNGAKREHLCMPVLWNKAGLEFLPRRADCFPYIGHKLVIL